MQDAFLQKRRAFGICNRTTPLSKRLLKFPAAPTARAMRGATVREDTGAAVGEPIAPEAAAVPLPGLAVGVPLPWILAIRSSQAEEEVAVKPTPPDPWLMACFCFSETEAASAPPPITETPRRPSRDVDVDAATTTTKTPVPAAAPGYETPVAADAPRGSPLWSFGAHDQALSPL